MIEFTTSRVYDEFTSFSSFEFRARVSALEAAPQPLAGGTACSTRQANEQGNEGKGKARQSRELRANLDHPAGGLEAGGAAEGELLRDEVAEGVACVSTGAVGFINLGSGLAGGVG